MTSQQQEGCTGGIASSSLSSNSNYYKHPMNEDSTYEYDQIEHSNSYLYSVFGQPLRYVGELLRYDASTNKLREDHPHILGVMISPKHAIVQQYSSMMSTLSSSDCEDIDCFRFTLNNNSLLLSSKVLSIHSVRSSIPHSSVCYLLLELELPIGQSSGYAGVITPGMQYYTSKIARTVNNNHTISSNILSKLAQTNSNNSNNNNYNSPNMEYSILDMDAHRIVLHLNTSMNNIPNNIYLQQSLSSDEITPSASTTPSNRQLNNNPSFSYLQSQSRGNMISSPYELQGWYFLNDESVGLQLLGFANERGVIQFIPVTEIYALMHPSEENQETEHETNTLAETRSVEVKEVNRNESSHLNNGSQQGSLTEVYAILRVNHDRFITSESDGCIRLWEHKNRSNTIDNSISSSSEQMMSLLHLGSSKSCRNLCMSDDCKFIYGIAGMEVFSIKSNQLNRGHTNTCELEIDTILCLGLQKEQAEQQQQQQQLLSLCALHTGNQLAAGDAFGNIYILDTTPILQIKQTIRVPLGKSSIDKKGDNQVQTQSSSANPSGEGSSTIPHPVYVLAPISASFFAAAVGTHGTIYVFNFSQNNGTFELCQTLEGHRKDKQIRFLHSDPSSVSRLVSAGDDKTIRIWDITTGQQVRKVQLANPIFCGVFLGTFELIIGDGKDIRVFDTRNWGYQKLSAHASSVKHLEKINPMSFISSDESGYTLRFSLLSSTKHRYLAECTLGSECASDGIVIQTNRVFESNHGEYKIYDSKERAMFQESQDELSFQQAQSEEEEQQQQINNHKDNTANTTTTASSSKNNITQNNNNTNNINNNTQDTAIVVSSVSFSQNITDTLIAHPYRESVQVGLAASITSSNILIPNKNNQNNNYIISPEETTPQARNSQLSQNTNHMLAQLSSPCRSSSTYINTPLQLTALQTPVLRTPFKTPAKMNQQQGQSSSSGTSENNNRFKSFSSSKYQPSAISNQHLNSNNNENANIFDCSNTSNNTGLVKLKGTKNTLQQGVYPFEGQFQHPKACVRCNSSQGQVSALVASLSKEKREAVSQVAEMKEEIQRLKHLDDMNFQLNSENALLRSQQAQHLATISQLSAALHRLTDITNKENNKSKDINSSSRSNNNQGVYQEQQVFEETQQLNTECMQFSRDQPTNLRTEQLQFSDTENGEKDGSISEMNAFDTDQTLGSYHPTTTTTAGGSFMQQQMQQQQQQQQQQVQLQINQFHRNPFTRTQGKFMQQQQQQQQQWQNEYSSYIKTDLRKEWDQIKKRCDDDYESNDESSLCKNNLHSNTDNTVLNLSIDKLLTKFLSQQELESARNGIPSKLPAHTVESSFPFSSDYQNPDHIENYLSGSISSLLFSGSSVCNTNGEQAAPVLSSRQKYRKIQIMAELRNAQDDLLNTKAKIEFLKQQHESNTNSSIDSNHVSGSNSGNSSMPSSNNNELSSARANMEAQYAQKLAGLTATLKHQKKEVDSWMKIYNDIYAKLHETELLLAEQAVGGAIAMGVQ